MVLLAFVLLTVSTLATHTEALPKDQIAVRHECGNKTLCHIKPAGYPQNEIDRAVLEQLPYLRRMKRAILNPVEPASGGNCKVQKSPMIPYTMRLSFDGKEHLPYYVVQSGLFAQTITQVKCVQESPSPPCFSNYLLPGVKTECKEKKMFSKLVVYDPVTGTISRARAEIAIDCACAIKNS